MKNHFHEEINENIFFIDNKRSLESRHLIRFDEKKNRENCRLPSSWRNPVGQLNRIFATCKILFSQDVFVICFIAGTSPEHYYLNLD